jgi:hypothetical protein
MGLGSRLCLIVSSSTGELLHSTAGKQHNRSSVIFINTDREPLVENSGRRQQQSVLALLRQPRVEAMQTVSGQFT